MKVFELINELKKSDQNSEIEVNVWEDGDYKIRSVVLSENATIPTVLCDY